MVPESETIIILPGTKVLRTLEATALEDEDCKIFVMELLWPLEQWAREVMIQLEEHEWLSPFNQMLLSDLKEFIRAMKGTLLAENVIKRIRANENSSGNGKSPPNVTWFEGLMSPEFEHFDRPLLKVSERGKKASVNSLGPDIYEHPLFQ